MSTPHIVLYDEHCPMCSFQMRLLTWMDWLGAFSIRALGEHGDLAAEHGLKREDLLAAIHCLAANGRIYRGARAIRFMSLRLPLGFLIGLFLWVPGVIWVAEIFYRWVSRNRYILSRAFGCKDACAVLPPREREADRLAEDRP